MITTWSVSFLGGGVFLFQCLSMFLLVAFHVFLLGNHPLSFITASPPFSARTGQPGGGEKRQRGDEKRRRSDRRSKAKVANPKMNV